MREREVRAVKSAPVPVVEIELAEPSALGAEFVRWEIATAVAGALLQINPFDEPNVQQAKDATRVLLDGFKARGHLTVPTPDRMLPGDIALTASGTSKQYLGRQGPDAIVTLLRQADYLGPLAYLGPGRELAHDVQVVRRA